METFECEQHYDAILFFRIAVLRYASHQLPVLRRLGVKLKPGGVFVVTGYQDIVRGFGSLS
jgi:hypothetical protein